jgi:hypothetical protein
MTGSSVPSAAYLDHIWSNSGADNLSDRRNFIPRTIPRADLGDAQSRARRQQVGSVSVAEQSGAQEASVTKGRRGEQPGPRRRGRSGDERVTGKQWLGLRPALGPWPDRSSTPLTSSGCAT